MNEFTNEKELKRDYTREHIKDYKNVTIHNEDEGIVEKVFGRKNNVPLKDITAQKNILINNSFSNKEIKKIALNTNIKSIKQGGEKAYHSKGNIVIREDYDKRTLIHEIGHNVDYNNKWLSSNNKFIEAIKVDKNYIVNNQNTYKNLIKNNRNYRELSDIIGGMTGNKIVGRYKHERKYWKKANKLERETFAQMFTIAGNDDIKQLQIFQEYLPNTFREFDNLIRRLI